MSTTVTAADAASAPKGKKKLLIIIGAVVLVLVLGGVGAVVMMKKKAAAAELAEEEGGADTKAKAVVSKKDPAAVPTFVPLDPFTVNLADRDNERYAQVAVTLEIEDAKLGEQIKLYMPAIRNNVLLAIADKTAAQLMEREGKAQLADKILKETSRALGYEVEEEEAEEETAGAKKKPRKKKAATVLPVKAVHFSNFIIQ